MARLDELAPHCRTPLLLLIGASIGGLLLGLHVGFSSRGWSLQLVRKVNGDFGAAGGNSSSAADHQQLICNTFPLKPEYASGNVTYNPAGVFDPRHGWVVIFRHEEGYEVPTWPLTMFMGSDRNAIDLGTAAERQTILALDEATLGPTGAATRGKPWLKAEDLRPFMWKGGVYVGHSLWGGQADVVWECISAVDLDQLVMKIEYCFDKMPIRSGFSREKNWAMGEVGGELLILHSLAACPTFLRYDPAAPKGLVMHSMTCFPEQQHPHILENTGVSLAGLHLSGHFQPFPKSLAALDAARRGRRPPAADELFVMAHTKNQNSVYSHWGFRIDASTLQLTHISRGPIISAYDLPAGSHTYLIVASYHFVERGEKPVPSLLAFFGLGDSQACSATVEVDVVDWYEVPPGNIVNVTEPGVGGYELV